MFGRAITVNDVEVVTATINPSEGYRLGVFQGNGQETNPSYGTYYFSYVPTSVEDAFGLYRYFLSWYEPKHRQGLVLLTPKGKKTDRLDYISATTLKKELNHNQARYIDLHAYVNWAIEVNDWNKTFKRKKDGKEFCSKAHVFQTQLHSKATKHHDMVMKQVQKYPHEYVVEGNYVYPRHTYCVIDVDFRGLYTKDDEYDYYDQGRKPKSSEHHPFFTFEEIRQNALRLRAVSVAETSFGCYHVVFKSLREKGIFSVFNNSSVRAILALELLGYSPRLKFPHIDMLSCSEIPQTVLNFLTKHGVDKAYMTNPCDNHITRVIGAFNYKKSRFADGIYLNDPMVYDFNSIADLYLNSDPIQIADISSSIYEPTSQPSIVLEAEHEVAVEIDTLSKLEATLKPLIRAKAYRLKWARLLISDAFFLSALTPQHGIGVTQVAAMFNVKWQQVNRTLNRMVEEGYLETNGVWDHPLKRDSKLKGNRTKRYRFGDKLAEFRVEWQELAVTLDAPYERHHSRSGIFRDIARLDRKGLKKADIADQVWLKYLDYVNKCNPNEVRSISDIRSMIDYHFYKKKEKSMSCRSLISHNRGS